MATTKTSPVSLSESTKTQLSDFITQWEKLANAYFWTPPSSASSRRSYEKYQSRELSIPEIGIDATIDVSCSCKNIYVTRTLKVNGELKRITALKKLLN